MRINRVPEHAPTVLRASAGECPHLDWSQSDYCNKTLVAKTPHCLRHPSMEALRALVADGAKLGSLLQPAQREVHNLRHLPSAGARGRAAGAPAGFDAAVDVQ